MKQFLKVLSVVKFIVEAAAMLVVSLFRIRAANVPRTGNCREMGDFPELLPRVIVVSKPLALGFHPLQATIRHDLSVFFTHTEGYFTPVDSRNPFRAAVGATQSPQ